MPHDAAAAAPGRPAPVPSPKAEAIRAGTPGAMRRMIGWGGLVLAVVLAASAPVLGFLWFLRAVQAPPTAPGRGTDGIVVLTGGADRVRTGLGMLVEGRAGRLLVSGAHPGVTLADLAVASDLPLAPLQGRVTLGHAARSTRGNAIETAAWARAEEVRSIRLVTSGYHMPRAILELRRKLPPEVEILPHPVVPAGSRDGAAAGRSPTWSLLLGEYAKLVGAALGVVRVERPVAEPGR